MLDVVDVEESCSRWIADLRFEMRCDEESKMKWTQTTSHKTKTAIGLSVSPNHSGMRTVIVKTDREHSNSIFIYCKIRTPVQSRRVAPFWRNSENFGESANNTVPRL